MAGLLSAAATAAAPAPAAAPVRVVLGTMTFAGQTDKESALRMVRKFAASPLSLTTPELDSARMYCGGQTEELLGEVLAELGTAKDSEEGEPPCAVATKANPFMDNTLTAEGVTAQLDATLRALQPAGSVDVFYLHAPDAAVAIEETLEAVQAAFEARKFKRFALSNFTAWETVWVHNNMKGKGWVVPVIYQGMMNAITRRVEDELFPALRRLGMSFYAYNPLAGGMLTGKHSRVSAKESGRFNGETIWGKIYQQRFMQEKQFDALEGILPACEAAGIPPAEGALRWMMHHSPLDGGKGDAVIIGASKMGHFEQNLAALAKGPLPASVVAAYDQGWEMCRGCAPNFSRGFSGGGASYL